MRRKLLIITSKDDTHTDHVIEKISIRGHQNDVIRLHTEDAIENCIFRFSNGKLDIELKDSEKTIFPSEVGCVWYRKPNDPLLPSNYAVETNNFVVGQTMTLIQGLYYLISDNAVWINPRSSSILARNKVKQLEVAEKIGFTVPDTLITNDPTLAVNFAHKHSTMCTKSIDAGKYVVYDQIYPIYTLKLSKDEVIAKAQTIQNCPTLFQQFIEKDFDLRVTVIGDQMFGVEIRSQDREESKGDFRMVSPDLLKHLPHALPTKLQAQIWEFMRHYGLLFSAFDFAVTKEGDYYFLENNPNGQWLWLEYLAGVPITNAFLHFFTKTLRWE